MTKAAGKVAINGRRNFSELRAKISSERRARNAHRLLEHHERLHQAHDEARAALADVQAEHVVLEVQPALDDVAGRRHVVVGRLRDDDEGVDIIRVY